MSKVGNRLFYLGVVLVVFALIGHVRDYLPITMFNPVPTDVPYIKIVPVEGKVEIWFEVLKLAIYPALVCFGVSFYIKTVR